MARVTADDIPTSVTQLVYVRSEDLAFNMPLLSQNQAARLLAHFWPEIEQHIRHQIADEFIRLGKTQETFTWGEAALIARGDL